MNERDKKLQIARVALAALDRTRGIHGLSNVPEYQIWKGMKTRCHPTKGDKNYGLKGIRVCERWENDVLAFISDMGFRPGPKYEIDRKDSNGDYTPDNCRWVTKDVQQKNRAPFKPKCFFETVEVLGKAHNLTELCKELGLNRKLVARRLRDGWSVEDAINRPPEQQPDVMPLEEDIGTDYAYRLAKRSKLKISRKI